MTCLARFDSEMKSVTNENTYVLIRRTANGRVTVSDIWTLSIRPLGVLLMRTYFILCYPSSPFAYFTMKTSNYWKVLTVK